MYDPVNDLEVTSGFLFVEKFEILFKKFADQLKLDRQIYAIPQKGQSPTEVAIRYSGMGRDALVACDDGKTLAELRLSELEEQCLAVDGIIFSRQEAQTVASCLEPNSTYEMIWVREVGSDIKPPDDFISVGFEPTYFLGSQFSALCDSMIFPMWHGTDEDGELFVDHFAMLNAQGLFPTAEVSQQFLSYYLSFDWTEKGDYVITEIFLNARNM